jgi:serine/threonine protein kinase
LIIFSSIASYLHVFSMVLDAYCALAATGVVHFDLKCDNVLVEPLGGTGAPLVETLADPEALGFGVAICDFGESVVASSAGDAGGDAGPARQSPMVFDSRGTECVKAPEMLLIANARRKDHPGYDRRRRAGAGVAADVWALGCLLYELVTGEYLFHDEDYSRFFVRLTGRDELLGEEVTKQLAGARGVEECV